MAVAIYSVFASATSVVNPEPAADTQIDSMTLTFTLGAGSNVVIISTIRFTKPSGGSFMKVKQTNAAGTLVSPLNDLSAAYPGWENFNNSQDGTNKQYCCTAVAALLSGSNTLVLTHQALGDTSTITFLDRSIVVIVP